MRDVGSRFDVPNDAEAGWPMTEGGAPDTPEGRLAQNAGRTDSPRFEEFYASRYRAVLRVVAGITGDCHDAEEITQEAFARAFIRWPSLRDSYESPEAWVRLVAVRLAIDFRRRLRGFHRVFGRIAAPRYTGGDALAPLQATPIGIALMKLSKRQREVLVLHYVADLPIKAISAEYDIPVDTVRDRLASGRRRLEQLLSEIEAETDASL